MLKANGIFGVTDLFTNDSQKDRKVMKDAAGNREKVPDGMKISDFFNRVEDDTDSVEYTADKQENQ